MELSADHAGGCDGWLDVASPIAEWSRAVQASQTGDRVGSVLRCNDWCQVAIRTKRLEGLRTGTVWFSNGKTILCGIVGAYAAVEIAKWIFEIRIKTGDSFAVPTAVAVGIGRLSCFVAGCCHGTPTNMPWGVRFQLADSGAVPRHPTQLYESAFHFGMAAWLVVLERRGVWRGQLIKLYIIAYMIYRLLSEFIRPEPRMVAGLTAYQWFALACIPIFAGLWWHDATRAKQLSEFDAACAPKQVVAQLGSMADPASE